MDLRPLRLTARLELVSLAALLANLATVHLPPLSALLGPLHGCSYLFVIAAAYRPAQATATTKAVALLPGIGGLLTLRLLDRSRPAGAGEGGKP